MKKLLNSIILIVLVYFPLFVSAEELDFDFTDETQDRVTMTYAWNQENKILELFGINIESQVILPEDSTVLIKNNTTNIIKNLTNSVIKSKGNLYIKGNGSLTLETNSKSTGYDVFEGISNIYIQDITLKTSGLTGIKTNSNLYIRNTKLDIFGYNNGIDIVSAVENKNISVEIINCTGIIKGQLTQGIELYNKSTGSANLLIEDSKDLSIIGNETNKKYHNEFNRSGIRVMSSGIDNVESQVKIKNSKNLYFTGTNTGIAVNCNSNGRTSETGACQASIIIEDSSIISETPTSVWAAFFVNNTGDNKESLSKISITNSKISSLAPNDIGMMTSSDEGQSIIEIHNSNLEVSGLYAGLRAKSNKTNDAEIIIVDNSLVVVIDKISTNHKTLDVMDKGVSTDGQDGVSTDSKVIAPIDCIITKNENDTWDIPDNGKVMINGEEKSYLYGALVKETREVLPYITNLNQKEFVDINEAINMANEGETVELLISDGTEEAILPKSITLTSQKKINVTTEEHGYKIKEEYINEKYVYTVVEADKYKVIFHYNYNSNKTITYEVYENTEYILPNDIFKTPKGKELDSWIISNEEYKSGDKIKIMQEDVNIYAKWRNETINPETSDSIIKYIILNFISLIIIITSIYYINKKRTI